MFQMVKSKKLCRMCLNKGHLSKNCKFAKAFRCRKCGKENHTTVLHFDKAGTNAIEASVNLQSTQTGLTGKVQKIKIDGIDSPVVPLLEVVKCLVIAEHPATGERRELTVGALLDSGSELTLINSDIAESLGMKNLLPVPKNVTITTVDGTTSHETLQVQFKLQDLEKRYAPMNVTGIIHEAKIAQFPSTKISMTEKEAAFWTRKGLPFSVVSPDFDVKILLGQPYFSMIGRNVKEVGPTGLPMLMTSSLGPFLAGGVITTSPR